MKQIAAILFSFFLLSNHASISQEIPEPDFSLKPYYLADGKLLPFEKVEAPMEAKVKGMGYGGVETSFSASGLKSPMRFHSGTPFSIIIKIEDNSDPTEGFIVAMGEIKKDRRRFVTGKMAAAFGSNKSKNEKRISIEAKKIRDKIFEIRFPSELQPGEYAIIPNQKNASMTTGSQSILIHCFGID